MTAKLGKPRMRKRTHNAGIDKRVFEVRIPSQELLVEEGCVLEVPEESDVNGVITREVFEVEALEESHSGDWLAEVTRHRAVEWDFQRLKVSWSCRLRLVKLRYLQPRESEI